MSSKSLAVIVFAVSAATLALCISLGGGEGSRALPSNIPGVSEAPDGAEDSRPEELMVGVPCSEPKRPVFLRGGYGIPSFISDDGTLSSYFHVGLDSGKPGDAPSAASLSFDTQSIGDTLWVHLLESSTGQGFDEDYWLKFASSLPIVAISARGDGDFLVALQEKGGWIVFERWTLVRPDGALAAPRSSQPVGQASAPLVYAPGTPHVVGGGSFVPRAARKGSTSLKRFRYEASFGGMVSTICVDADARFAIVCGPDSVYRFDLHQGTIDLLWDAVALDLEFARIGLSFIGASETEGRVLMLRSLNRAWYLKAVDQDNDGAFESFSTGEDLQLYSAEGLRLMALH